MGSQHQALLEAMVRLFELNILLFFSFSYYKVSTLGHGFDKIPCISVVSVTLSCSCYSYQSSPLFITL